MNTFNGYASAIHCEGCADSIKRSLGKLPGIEDVNIDINAKMVRATYDSAQTTEAVILARLDAAGFPIQAKI